jgi:RNA polymerase sigma-70 factor (ECF subfamily)
VSDRQRAFEELWRKEYARVLRTAYLITGDVQEAADVTQEAFARAYERGRSVLGMERPDAWLQRVATNLAISWRRQMRRRRNQQAPVGERFELGGPDPDLMAALRLLSPAQRAVIALRFFADQSVDQAARALHKRPGTVKALTSQAVHRLREILGEVDRDVRR